MGTIWEIVGIAWQWKRFLFIATGVAAVVSVVIALLLPVWFQSSARLLLPESGGSSITSALMGDLPSAAKSFLGGTTGNYTRYLAILESRTIHQNIVQKYDLTSVYNISDSPTAIEDAIEVLRSKTNFSIDDELEFMSISVLDRDPNRAADLVNEFVHQLNTTNARLSSLTAANFRRYVERRYQESMSKKDSIQVVLANFQEEHGIYDVEIQSQAFFDQVATVRASALEAEIQYEALRSRLGPNNPQVASYREIVAASSRKFERMLAGSEVVLPVPQDSIPNVFRKYSDLRLKLFIEEKTLEVVAPLLEQARFDEQKSFEAVQVVDEAIPATRKAKPQRAVLCIMITLSVFILSIVFIVCVEWWKRNAWAVENAIAGS